MNPKERATYHVRQSLKGRLTQARMRLKEAALDQRNPSIQLKRALRELLAIEDLIKEHNVP